MGARIFPACALAATLLWGCQSTPSPVPTSWEGIYQFTIRGSSSRSGQISLQWTEAGYEGFLKSPTRDLELLEATPDEGSIRLRFERDGVRMFIVLIQRDGEIRGTWQEMGGGGQLDVTRVSR